MAIPSYSCGNLGVHCTLYILTLLIDMVEMYAIHTRKISGLGNNAGILDIFIFSHRAR